MLSIETLPTGLDGYHAFRGSRPIPAPAARRAAEEAARTRLLADYLEGWAEADPRQDRGRRRARIPVRRSARG